MSKYDQLKVLIRRKARNQYQCESCNATIQPGDFYYSEELSQRIPIYFEKRKFCAQCYQQSGDNLLGLKF